MKFALAFTIAAFVGCAVESANTTCTRLTDSTASLYSAIPYLADKESDFANLPLYELLAPIDKELPWLSTCLGSANVLSVGIGLLTSSDASKCVSLLTGGGESLMPSSNGTEDIFAASLCPSMNTTIFPCVSNVLAKAIDDLVASGGDCCTEMSKKLPELLGQDLKGFLASLMIRIGDVLCSVKTIVDPVAGTTETETCGANLLGILGNGQGLDNLIQMLQIPNDQACAAMKGEPFTATGGDTFQFFVNQESLDSCFAPMNLLFTDLAKLPMISTSDFSPAFAADKCLKGESILEWALDAEGIVQGFASAFDGIVANMKLAEPGEISKIVRAGFEDMQKDFDPLCFHLANSVTNCVYNTSVAYAFSSDSPPPSIGSGGSSSPETSQASKASSALAIGTTIVVALVSTY